MQRLFLLLVFMLVLLPISYAEEPDEPMERVWQDLDATGYSGGSG